MVSILFGERFMKNESGRRRKEKLGWMEKAQHCVVDAMIHYFGF
jgi:hypothetical protein